MIRPEEIKLSSEENGKWGMVIRPGHLHRLSGLCCRLRHGK
jgi:hypothetical protein